MSRAKPAVLAISSEVPWPLDSGGHLRTFHLLKALASTFDVTLVAAATAGDDCRLEQLRAHGIAVEAAAVAPRRPAGEWIRAARCALTRRPYVMFGRHDRRPVRATIARLCATRPPRLVYMDHLDAFAFAPLVGPLPCVLDLHNIYSLIARREADGPRPPWVQAYLRREATLLARAERRGAQAVDAVLSVSERERRYYEGLGARATHLIPNGVDCSRYEDLPTGRDAAPPTILYVGSMSWAPNVDAALFLARDVVPRLRHTFPHVRLRIVGRDPAPALVALRGTPGVEVTGAVADISRELAAATVLAVPLRVGGGTRLKILEAFAAGLPVVSSAIGCEGLDVADGAQLLVAERERFVAALSTAFENDGLRRAVSERARELVRRTYDWSVIGARARDVIADLLLAHPPLEHPGGPQRV